MCGVFLVCSLNDEKIPYENFLAALPSIESRGPNHTIIRSNSTETLRTANSVLSITTSYSSAPEVLVNAEDILLYNGELYESSISFDSDTEHIYAYRDRYIHGENLATRGTEGMLALVLFEETKMRITFLTDACGEKPLYYYHTSNLLIISSNISAILDYNKASGQKTRLKTEVLRDYLFTRHLLVYTETIYENLYKCIPGRRYVADLLKKSLHHDNYSNIVGLLTESQKLNVPRLTQEKLEDAINRRFIGLERHNVASVISGGVDSTLVSFALNSWRANKGCKTIHKTYSLNFGDKDPSAYLAPALAQDLGLEHSEIYVTRDLYLEHLLATYRILRTPLPTHSFASQSILASHVKADGFQVLLGGEGGDEVFQGYNLYDHLLTDSQNSISHYSNFDISLFEATYNGHPRRAELIAKSPLIGLYRCIFDYDEPIDQYQHFLLSFILDATLQLSSTGLLSSDQICSYYGLEARSPLVDYDLMKMRFARLNGKGGLQVLDKKLPLRSLLARFSGTSINSVLGQPKYGFSGFPNEATDGLVTQEQLNSVYELLEIPFIARRRLRSSREMRWKVNNLALFLDSDLYI
jgi:asparagine synthetase B (glutamine-hydrolysing)